MNSSQLILYISQTQEVQATGAPAVHQGTNWAVSIREKLNECFPCTWAHSNTLLAESSWPSGGLVGSWLEHLAGKWSLCFEEGYCAPERGRLKGWTGTTTEALKFPTNGKRRRRKKNTWPEYICLDLSSGRFKHLSSAMADKCLNVLGIHVRSCSSLVWDATSCCSAMLPLALAPFPAS